MATRTYYLTHPEVAIDPAVPVPQWGLSPRGQARAFAAAGAAWLTAVSRIVASGERKAIECAELIAAPRGLPVEVRADMGENDRSATGFLTPAEFEGVADALFARPQESVRGWERAVDAQARIVRAFADVVSGHGTSGDLLLVGHGAVGTLLMCHLAGWPIARTHDQKGGGGNVFTFDLGRRRVIHAWRPLEAATIGAQE